MLMHFFFSSGCPLGKTKLRFSAGPCNGCMMLVACIRIIAFIEMPAGIVFKGIHTQE